MVSESRVRKGPKYDDELFVLQRRKQVASYYLQGLTQVEIAAKLVPPVAQTTVSNDLVAIRKGWEASAILDWDEAKAKELAGIDYQLEELYKAWHRSCEAERIRTSSTKKEPRILTEGIGKNKKVTGYEMIVVEHNKKVVVRQLIGDPRFMAEITKLRELRCKILGVLKEEKAKTEVSVQVINWDQVADVRGADPIEEQLKQVQMLPSPPPEVT